MPPVTPALSLMLSKDCSSIPRTPLYSAATAVKSLVRISPAMRWPVISINCCSSYENRYPRRCIVALSRRAYDRLLVVRAGMAEPTRGVIRNRRTLARQLEECALWRQWQAARDHNTAKRRSLQSSVSRHLSFCALSCLRGNARRDATRATIRVSRRSQPRCLGTIRDHRPRHQDPIPRDLSVEVRLRHV